MPNRRESISKQQETSKSDIFPIKPRFNYAAISFSASSSRKKNTGYIEFFIPLFCYFGLLTTTPTIIIIKVKYFFLGDAPSAPFNIKLAKQNLDYFSVFDVISRRLRWDEMRVMIVIVSLAPGWLVFVSLFLFKIWRLPHVERKRSATKMFFFAVDLKCNYTTIF